MNQLIEWLSRLFGSWKFWVIVPPWDVGVRVRMGKVASELKPGPHFRIPFIDEVVLINTRIRIVTPPCVTINTPSGKTRVITASVSYQIADPVKAMLSYSSADHAVMCLTQSMLCDGKPDAVALTELRVELEPKGIKVHFLRYVEDVEVKTYRLLNDTWKLMGDNHGTPISMGPNGNGATRW